MRRRRTALPDAQDALRDAIDYRHRAATMAAVGGADLREQAARFLVRAEEIEARVTQATVIEVYARRGEAALLWARTPGELAEARREIRRRGMEAAGARTTG